MSVHAYPPETAFADFARAGAGLFLAAAPLMLADTVPVVTAILALLVVVFAIYALRTVNRQLTRLEVDEDAVSTLRPRTRTVPWRTLRRVKLAYYSTRRDRTGGWMQLTLAGDGRTLSIDSRIAGFQKLAERAARAARTNGLALDPATLYNFHALGLPLEDADGMGTAENRR